MGKCGTLIVACKHVIAGQIDDIYCPEGPDCWALCKQCFETGPDGITDDVVTICKHCLEKRLGTKLDIETKGLA